MKSRFSALAAVLALTAAVPALAQVEAEGAWVRGVVPGQKATGAFLTLRAPGGARLVGVSTPVAGTAELHEMKMDGDTMRMRSVAEIAIPAGSAVALKPGGYHLMLSDLKGELKTGSTVPLTLRFVLPDGKSFQTEVKAEVRALTGMSGSHAHGDHEH